jgi:hypothetical protein
MIWCQAQQASDCELRGNPKCQETSTYDYDRAIKELKWKAHFDLYLATHRSWRLQDVGRAFVVNTLFGAECHS